MRIVVSLLLLFVLVYGHVLTTRQAVSERKILAIDLQTPTALPGPLLRLSALEFKGVLADFLFLKALVFIGASDERTTVPAVTPAEWQWLLTILNSTVDLDPMFIDPYYFANAVLVWDGHLVREANALLDKGRVARSWDWQLPFYMGFNSFYFLEDDTAAVNYMIEASGRPDAPPSISSLVVRLAYKGARTDSAILFLQQMLAQTEDDKRQKDFQLRLEALLGIRKIEHAVVAYHDKFNRFPVTVEDLLHAGVIKSLPVDPFGGNFYIDAQQRVRTTSDLRNIQKEKTQDDPLK